MPVKKIDMTNLFKGFYTLPGADEAFDKADAHAAGTCGCGQEHHPEQDKESTLDVAVLQLPGPSEDEMRRNFDRQMNEQFFVQGATFLMDAEKWFLPPINEICRLLADVIQAGGIRVEGQNPVRPVMDFMVGVRKGDKPDVAKILIPKGWWQRMMQNPWYKLGGIVFMASHACDFYYGMLPSMRRAKAWEAQFLLAVLGKVGHYKLNSYQKVLLERFPLGLNSIHDAMRYPWRGYVQKTTRAPGREKQGRIMFPLWKE